jgi:hypothetical protein
MATFTPTKNIQTPLISLQTLATAANSGGAGVINSNELNVSTKWLAFVMVTIGRTAGTAFTAGRSVDVFIQGAGTGGTAGTNQDQWYDLAAFQTGALATCTSNGITASGGSAGIGNAVTAITLSANAGTDYSINKDWLYFRNATVANGEFHRTRFASTSGTNLWIVEELERAQHSGTVFNGNYRSRITPIDLGGVTRLRAQAINNSGLSVDVEVRITTQDDVTG